MQSHKVNNPTPEQQLLLKAIYCGNIHEAEKLLQQYSHPDGQITENLINTHALEKIFYYALIADTHNSNKKPPSWNLWDEVFQHFELHAAALTPLRQQLIEWLLTKLPLTQENIITPAVQQLLSLHHLIKLIASTSNIPLTEHLLTACYGLQPTDQITISLAKKMHMRAIIAHAFEGNNNKYHLHTLNSRPPLTADQKAMIKYLLNRCTERPAHLDQAMQDCLWLPELVKLAIFYGEVDLLIHILSLSIPQPLPIPMHLTAALCQQLQLGQIIHDAINPQSNHLIALNPYYIDNSNIVSFGSSTNDNHYPIAPVNTCLMRHTDITAVGAILVQLLNWCDTTDTGAIQPEIIKQLNIQDFLIFAVQYHNQVLLDTILTKCSSSGTLSRSLTATDIDALNLPTALLCSLVNKQNDLFELLVAKCTDTNNQLTPTVITQLDLGTIINKIILHNLADQTLVAPLLAQCCDPDGHLTIAAIRALHLPQLIQAILRTKHKPQRVSLLKLQMLIAPQNDIEAIHKTADLDLTIFDMLLPLCPDIETLAFLFNDDPLRCLLDFGYSQNQIIANCHQYPVLAQAILDLGSKSTTPSTKNTIQQLQDQRSQNHPITKTLIQQKLDDIARKTAAHQQLTTQLEQVLNTQSFK